MAKATAAFKTSDLVLPTQVVAEMVDKITNQSVIATLVGAKPQLFVDKEHLIFTQKPHAELVSEGGAKSSSDFAFTPVEGKRYKVQTTVRINEEVRYADADNRLYVLDQVTGALADSIAEAVDLVGIHEINPLTGEKASTIAGEGLISKATKVELAGDFPTVEELDSLPDSIIGAGYTPNGIAFAPTTANALRKMRNTTDGSYARIYPDIRMDLQVGNFEGLRSVTSAYVSGVGVAKEDTGVQAIMGKWDLLDWGFVRSIALEEILYGDPDGLGDLKRYNQIAYRAEAIFSIVNFDPKGFAYLTSKKA